MPRVAVIKFPGTNCDEDVLYAIRSISRLEGEIVWYKEFTPDMWDAVIIPGGFSYGDWLRAGAIAAKTVAMEKLTEAAPKGIPVLGICNGFQILVEAGLLPGALALNDNAKFVCKWVKLYVERPKGPWLSLAENGMRIDMPVAHGEGRYVADAHTLSTTNSRSILKYYRDWNPNGSVDDIAGLSSEDGLILGLMPHPERAVDPVLVPRGFVAGGRVVFESIAYSLKRGW